MTIDEVLQISYPQGKVLADTIFPIVPDVPLMITENLNVFLGIAGSSSNDIYADESLGLVNGAVTKFHSGDEKKNGRHLPQI